MGNTMYAVAAAGILCLGLLCAGHGPLAGELPPLEVGEDAPRLKDAEKDEKKDEGPTADNQHCFVCHGNYRGEALTEVHASAHIGCMECHGPSDAHRGDEANVTPPDRMFPLEDINPYCRKCHKEHDVQPRKIIDRWLERAPHRTGAQRTMCTDCHGQHRLESRDTQWNKRTGELLLPL
ncbi:MAG: cytochrome c3 family protein, partial [Planctomycetota bacterium]